MDSQKVTIIALVSAGLFALFVGCAGAFGVALWSVQRDTAPPEETAMPSEPWAPSDQIAPSPPTLTPADEATRLAAMRQRYRPGPYVSVEGMLPTGRLRHQRVLGEGPRTGRTIDNPWVVAGAELRPGAAPNAGDPAGGGPSITHSAGQGGAPLTVLPGVPARFGVGTGDGRDHQGPVEGLLIAFHGYSGHFFLPSSVDTELGHIRVAGADDATVHFGIDAPVQPGGGPITGPYEVTMYVASVDLAGRVSPYLTRSLTVMPVGKGDVEVALTMGQATDLDLYVVDATGVAIYYGNTTSISGGQLDLDANAACGGNMGVNNEHIFWAKDQAPAGTYTVRVANYQSCINGQPVDYQVTVRNCGETVVLSGRFEGEGQTRECTTAPGTDRAWCQQVVEFEVSPCDTTALTPSAVL